MRRIVLSLLIISIIKFCCAQNSARNTLAYNQREIDNLNNVAFDTYLNSPDSARKIAENALLLSQKCNYAIGKGRSFYNIGLIYWSQSYYTISLFYLNSAITDLPANKPLYLSDCSNALGRTYADLGNYTQAMLNLNRSLYYAGADSGRMAEVYSERAYVYCAQKEYNKAIDAAQYALKLNLNANATSNVAVLYARLGAIYRYKRDFRTALDYTDIAYNMSRKIFNRRLRAKLYVEYANLNNEIDKYDKAIDYAQKGVRLADSIGVADAEIEGYDALVDSYEKKGDLQQALFFQKRYTSKSDSISNAVKLKTVSLVQNYYALNSKLDNIKLIELTNLNNSAKIRTQNKLIIILSSSLLILVTMLSITYYFYKHKKLLSNKLKNQHKVLFEQKQLIEVQKFNLQKVNDLKDKLLAVIGHDLRTPVANLTNIIEMFSEGYLTANEVNELMREISPIVKGTELTLLNLTEWAGSQIKGQTVNPSTVDIFLLGVEMEQTFMHSLQLKNLDFVNRAYPGQGVHADENHLKVILRNLISNAIKFTNKGDITLSTVIEKNHLIISIKDSGNGMSVDEVSRLFYLNTHFSNFGTLGEKGTGIGLLLCKELVELNGGKIGVLSEIGKGSTFYFNLPLVNAYA